MSQEVKKHKILLVDDDNFICTMVAGYLKDTDFDLTAKNTVEDALIELQRTGYDIIVSDVLMSPLDGFDFRDEVRKMYPTLPFVFLTAMTNSTDNVLFNRIMDDLFSYYVQKDSGKKVLIRRLQEIRSAFELRSVTLKQQQELDQSMQLATLMQQSVLPSWAFQTKVCEFSYLYRPHKSISGDLVEYYPLRKGHSALLVLGDISGHGTHAALAMMAIQSFLNVMVKEENSAHPEDIARLVHQYLLQQFPGKVAMGALFVYWDFDQNLLRFLNAGQPEPFCLLGPNRDLLMLNPERRGTLALGLYDKNTIHDDDVVEIKLPEDAIFCAYTDGLLDISKDPEGEQTLTVDDIARVTQKCLQEMSPNKGIWGLPFREFEAIHEAEYLYQQDDCTLLAFRKRPHGENNSITRNIPISMDEANKLANDLGEHVEHVLHDAELAAKVDLLLNEFLINCIKHGRDKQMRRHERIVVRCDCEPDGQTVQISVWDYCTSSWDTSRLETPPKTEPDALFEELNEKHAITGRGIPIMQTIASKITCNQWSGINETIFTIPVTQAENQSA